MTFGLCFLFPGLLLLLDELIYTSAGLCMHSAIKYVYPYASTYTSTAFDHSADVADLQGTKVLQPTLSPLSLGPEY